MLSALTAWASGRPPGLRRSVRLARRWECESTQVAVVCTSSFDRSVLKSFLVVRDKTGGIVPCWLIVEGAAHLTLKEDNLLTPHAQGFDETRRRLLMQECPQ